MTPAFALPATVGLASDRDREREFEEAVDREGRRLYALALSVLGDVAEAQDAVQETMVQAWRDWDGLRDQARRAAWLATICVRTCLRHRRRLRRRLGSVVLLGEHAALPSTSGMELIDACRRLSPRQRAVVILHYLYGYSLDECGPILGCRPGTVRPHLRRALEKLRTEYADD